MRDPDLRKQWPGGPRRSSQAPGTIAVPQVAKQGAIGRVPSRRQGLRFSPYPLLATLVSLSRRLSRRARQALPHQPSVNDEDARNSSHAPPGTLPFELS